ncbi:MAG: glycosyltransferase family 1 protein [Candidatus Methanomethylicota archaeon]|uniref:Glycosyltransferase family 1 protein n=1 Tax=Thermoproteota archaeon TaxID=2056631 RepID=A0A497EJ29_9CREN|nr:MAG: glycosyltransferase family 1 protein [Candidatus Verstraetearchaeota archaeon]
MKLVVTTPYYPPHVGGIEFHVQNVVRRLRENHNVTVISSTGYDEIVRVVTVPSIDIPYAPLPVSFPNIEADVYHSHIPSPFFAYEILKRNLKPHVITYHNDVFVPRRVGGYRIPRVIAKAIEYTNTKITKKLLESADAIIATTLSYAKTSPLLSEFDVTIIPNGVNTKSIPCGAPAGSRDKIVLYTGRLVEYKGLEILINAMKYINAKLVVIGDGEDRQRFQKLAKESNIDALFTGKVSEETKFKWMRRARVLVLPSLNRLEAFGIALVEAMACGTPVLASNLPGVRDVAREGGMIFNDLNDLINKINKILERDSLATRLGKRGRHSAKKYDWSNIVKKIENVYLQLT